MSAGPFMVTTKCNSPAPTNGVVLFPPGQDPPKGVRVLVTTEDGKKKIALKGDKRSDEGAQGLCLSQASIDKLGGPDVLVNVRGLRLPAAAFHDTGLFLHILATVLTFVLAILGGLTAYTSVGPEDPSLVLKAAPWLLGLTFLAAIVTLFKSVKEA